MRTGFTSLGAATAAAAAALVLIWVHPHPAASTARQHLVEMRGLEFIPKELTVSPGDTVIWVNRDLVAHTVTAHDESWDSGLVPSRGRWQTVVSADMGSAYFCRYHPSMTGRLRVAGP